MKFGANLLHNAFVLLRCDELTSNEDLYAWHSAAHFPPRPFDVVANPLDQLTGSVRNNHKNAEFAERHTFLGEENATFGEEPQQADNQNGTRDDDARIFIKVKSTVHAAADP